LKSLAGCPALSGLQHLDLSCNNSLDEEDVKALAQSPYLNKLHYLNLILGDVSPDSLKALFHSPNVKKLLVLILSSRMTDSSASNDAFFSSPLPEQLLRLRFFHCREHEIPGRYRETLEDRLVVSSEL